MKTSHLVIALAAILLTDSDSRAQRYRQVSTKSSKAVNPTQAKQRFALVIAVREYNQSDRLGTLPGTNREAEKLVVTLKKSGFASSHVVLMHDDATSADRKPVKAMIELQVRQLLGRAREGDLVTVFLTGHGVAVGGQSYYCPADATNDALSEKAVADEKLVSIRGLAKRLSKQCKASHKLIVVDACRDTGSKRTQGYVTGLDTPTEGVWIMSGCSEGQYSWMCDQIRPGENKAIFSHYLREGLQGAADILGDNDGEVGLFELYTYAYIKTRRAAEVINEEQDPELFGLASPFTVARSGQFVARRKLTTSDPELEAKRSALHLADDGVINLRAAKLSLRKSVSNKNTNEKKIEADCQALHRYLCHLLGNRIRAALELDPDCPLAHIARGLCFRTCEMYDEALEAFVRGGEPFHLFVKPKSGTMDTFLAKDRSGQVLRHEDQNPVGKVSKGRQQKEIGTVVLYSNPQGEPAKQSIARQAKVTISEVQGDWLRVAAINDQPSKEQLWIRSNDVHWFPEAVDLYTPSTPMRSWGNGMAGSRLDQAADQLHAVADRLSLPAQRIEQVAQRLDAPAARLRAAAGRMRGGPVLQTILGYAGVPNYPARILDEAAYWAGRPAAELNRIAGYARIPSNYVQVAGGYARAGGNLSRSIAGWSSLAYNYRQGQRSQERTEKVRKRLQDAGRLAKVVARPLLVKTQ